MKPQTVVKSMIFVIALISLIMPFLTLSQGGAPPQPEPLYTISNMLANETSGAITINGLKTEPEWEDDADNYTVDNAGPNDFKLFTMANTTHLLICVKMLPVDLYENEDWCEVYFELNNSKFSAPHSHCKKFNLTGTNATQYYEGNGVGWTGKASPPGWGAKSGNGVSPSFEFEIPLNDLDSANNFSDAGEQIGFGVMVHNFKAGTKVYDWYPDDLQVGSITTDNRSNPGNWSNLEYTMSCLLPSIANITDTPDPQDQNGYVNITSDVDGINPIANVFVNITYPNSTTTNQSLSSGAGTEFYKNQTFPIAGQYSYFLWANTTCGSDNTSSVYYFNITDTEVPDINTLIIVNDPLILHAQQLIRITPRDNIDTPVQLTAYINYTYPNATTQNYSMDYLGLGQRYRHFLNFNVTGQINLTIWVNDTAGNFNSTSGSFNVSAQPPDILNFTIYPDNIGQRNYVNISNNQNATLCAIVNMKYNITYPDGTWINTTLNVFNNWDPVLEKWYLNQIYTETGYYNVTATILDACGFTNTTWGTFRIFSSSLLHGGVSSSTFVDWDFDIIGFTVQFNYTGNARGDFKWSFGDGFGSERESPAHRYPDMGSMRMSYNVTLSVTTASNTNYSETKIIVIERPFIDVVEGQINLGPLSWPGFLIMFTAILGIILYSTGFDLKIIRHDLVPIILPLWFMLGFALELGVFEFIFGSG